MIVLIYVLQRPMAVMEVPVVRRCVVPFSAFYHDLMLRCWFVDIVRPSWTVLGSITLA
jgi:hypothetical protein